VLAHFKQRRQPGKARTDYLQQLSRDLADYFGYNLELVEMFMKLFSPAEALEFFDANEQVPVHINSASFSVSCK
jgi:ribosomal RNA methyltransferase Nop2